MTDRKPVEFRGSALADLQRFPTSARREAGHQLDQVQQGLEPDDWKPMTIVEVVFRKSGYAMRPVCSVSSTWRYSPMPFMCCTVS